MGLDAAPLGRGALAGGGVHQFHPQRTHLDYTQTMEAYFRRQKWVCITACCRTRLGRGLSRSMRAARPADGGRDRL